jgi:hypothetical protein
MTLLFDQVLDECIKQATANDDLAKRLFLEGDIAHLQRWRNDGRAAAIWEALRPGRSSDAAGMFRFVFSFLRVRRIAEETNQLNKTISELKRSGKRLAPKERRRAMKLLANGDLSPQEFLVLEASFKEAESGRDTNFLDPIFAVRSDERGTRRRSIFCRIACDLIRRGTNRWHYGQIAALCEIALDCKDVTTDMVRSYRDAGRREATRKKRRSPLKRSGVLVKPGRT